MAAPKKDDLKAKFEAAAAAAKQTKKKPDNPTLLKLYSYYEQATDGDVKGARPGGFDFVGGAKHDAWAGGMGLARLIQVFEKMLTTQLLAIAYSFHDTRVINIDFMFDTALAAEF